MAERFYICKEEDCNTAFQIDCSSKELEEKKVCPECGSKNVDMDFSGGKGKGYKNFGLIWKTPVYGGSGNG